MNRRSFLKAVGAISGTTVVTAGAGCLEEDADVEAANEFGYDTYRQSGVDVPLVPVVDAAEWFDDDTTDVVFADTRSQEAYEDARIAGAVFSPAPEGLSSGDPFESISPETRIVTYCVCPHSLATSRGASLIKEDYLHTYALDEGLQGWASDDLPMEGEDPTLLHLDAEYHTES